MSKYLLVYTLDSSIPAPSAEAMMAPTPEQREAILAAWNTWFSALGDRLVDGGNPTSVSATVSQAGRSEGASSGITDYSIIQADNLDEAAELARSRPIVSDGGVIHVYETFAVM